MLFHPFQLGIVLEQHGGEERPAFLVISGGTDRPKSLGLVLVTGATDGLPYVAGRAAIAAGGVVLGISPARDATEHQRVFGKPVDGSSHIVYTGLGLNGRNVLNVRNCDASVFVSGGAGTLQEFCIAIYDGQVIGVLTNSGGVAAVMPEIVARCRNMHGSEIIFDTTPRSLIDQVVRCYISRQRATSD